MQVGVFNKKGKRYHCFCNRRVNYCTEEACKQYGKEHGIKVGSEMCEHGCRRSQCKDCGGSQICEHGRQRSKCKECGGGGICEHDRERAQCQICDPTGYVACLRRNRRYKAVKTKTTGTLEDLCMTVKDWNDYLNGTFERNYGYPRTDDVKVHIDEIIPCSAWDLPTENKYCWHYLNSQYLLADENMSKRASYTEEDKRAMIARIDAYYLDTANDLHGDGQNERVQHAGNRLEHGNVFGEGTVPNKTENEGGDEDVQKENEDLLDDFGPVTGLGEDFLEHFTIN